jgi:hypothetical protein
MKVQRFSGVVLVLALLLTLSRVAEASARAGLPLVMRSN